MHAVLKPASQTPYSALALAELAERAGIPKGVLNIVTGDARSIGAELCTNPDGAQDHLHGSTEIGRVLMRQSADTIKKLSLELGGNAPFIVFDDADLMPPPRGRSLPSTATPARRASARIASTSRTRCTTRSPRSSPTRSAR
jgi:acyl-CoA reductase-like NAD-dependent aldehyde dehydrogenase